MTSKPSNQTQKEFIDYRFNEMDKKLTRIEQKMDGYTYAKQADVDKLAGVAETVETRLTVLEQKLKPIEKIYYLVFGAIVTGIISLGFYLLQKAIQ